MSGSFGIKGNTCSQEFLLSSFFPKSSSNEKTASYQTLESSLQKLAAAAIKIILMKSFGGLFLLNRIWNLGWFGPVVESLIRSSLTLLRSLYFCHVRMQKKWSKFEFQLIRKPYFLRATKICTSKQGKIFSALWMVFPESWKRSCPNFYAHDCTSKQGTFL